MGLSGLRGLWVLEWRRGGEANGWKQQLHALINICLTWPLRQVKLQTHTVHTYTHTHTEAHQKGPPIETLIHANGAIWHRTCNMPYTYTHTLTHTQMPAHILISNKQQTRLQPNDTENHSWALCRCSLHSARFAPLRFGSIPFHSSSFSVQFSSVRFD